MGKEGKIVITYDPSISLIINKESSDLPENHPCFDSGEVAREVLVMKTRIDRNSKKEYYLIYSSGPSCDIGYHFFDISENKIIGWTWGEEIVVNGNGNIYSAGHNNQTFFIRRKYELQANGLKEVVPEFYYVGLETTTLKNLTLYTDQSLLKVLAQLPKDYSIEVLLAKYEKDFGWKYLIKTPIGLLGWAKIDVGQSAMDVEGIYFDGD